MTVRVIAAAVTAAALVAGCQTTVPGTPESSTLEPTEPTVSTPRPTRTTPPETTTPLIPEPSTPTAAPPGDVLPPNDSGYVFIETKSGQTRCQLNEQMAGCEAQFTNSPQVEGGRANGVRITADGKVSWILGNMGDIPVVTIDYRTYSAVGWTIDATEAGTRFTNDATGHGMFVAIEKVDTF